MQPSKTLEPIPGYFLKERIGVGGYGEVWSAQAPGDLAKAIKFVYGHFDDERAARELKALQRIREVRHPFLLSLERFEIIDGQLLIVTELADMSLKDRYGQAKNSGAESIPRDELLGYLRDAADALDYMSENFSLQHLDVKPENLLLVGGRVKVADFGLVKELHDVTASLMGGLTPVYASPEVFDGRPTQRSDQYSLAIVYQEMLTAALPFPGRTAAQLASQHLHASPRLAALPAKDQPIIARALSKDPAKRFPNCRSLIDALLGADQWIGGQPSAPEPRRVPREIPKGDTTANRSHLTQTDVNWKSPSGPRPTPEPPSRLTTTQVINGRSSSAWNDGPAAPVEAFEVMVPLAPPIEPVVELPPLELAAGEAELRPTLVIGIGGTGAQTLRQLRRRICGRFGSPRSIASLQMLLLDTDGKSLYQATQGDADTALGDTETLAMPLRNARDYTTNSANILQWLSRRWLYNIPRSLQTEGRRPLGRLALVDHAQQAYERIRKALVDITSEEAVAASSAAAGQTYSNAAPRVLVVSSLSGGTGGGMVLDVAHLARKVLADLSLPAEVCGFLTHSTDRNPSTNDLALANAYACLSELHHYNGPSYYPGDPACGLPSAEPGEHTFTHAYFVNLGSNLSDDQFDQATDDLASYLYLNSVTEAGGAFDQCRQSTPSEGPMSVRTFGLACVGSSHTALPAVATQLLLKELLDRWCRVGKASKPVAAPKSLLEQATQGDSSASLTIQSTADQVAAAHARQAGLELEPLTKKFAKLVEKELGGDAEAILEKLRAKIIQKQASATSGRVGYMTRMLQAIGSLFGASSGDDDVAPTTNALLSTMEAEIKEFATPLAATVRAWILSLLESPGSRIGAAWHAKDWYVDHLRSTETAVFESLAETQQNIQATEQMLWSMEQAPRGRRKFFGGRGLSKPTAEKDGALLHVIRLRLKETELHGLTRLLRSIVAQVVGAGDLLKDLQRELGRLSQSLGDTSNLSGLQATEGSEDAIGSVRATLAEKLQARLPELAHRVDEQVQTQYLEGQGGLRKICEHAQTVQAALMPALRAAARVEIMRALKDEPIAELLLGTDGQTGQAARLAACVEAARPRLTECGGGQRLFAILPDSAAGSALKETLANELTPPSTLLHDSDADLVLCYEVQELTIPHVAAVLIGDRGDVIQIANRLHTRGDVTWSKLPDVAKDTASTVI